jgi:hypothetical protein
MARIEIDSSDNPKIILLAARFLSDMADILEPTLPGVQTRTTVVAPRIDPIAASHVHTPAAPPPPATVTRSLEEDVNFAELGFGGQPLPAGATPLALASAPSTAGAPPPPIAPAASTSTGAPPAPPPAPDARPLHVPAASGPVPGVDRDKRGFAWDPRVHQESRKKNADGTWANKRGIDKALLAAVEAELSNGAPAAPTPVTHIGSGAPIAPPVTAGAPPPPATPATVGQAQSFRQLMQKVRPLEEAGLLDVPLLLAGVRELGLTAISDFMGRPDLIPKMSDYLDAVTQ